MKRDVKAILSGGKRVRATLVESAYIGQIAIMTVNMAILSKKRHSSRVIIPIKIVIIYGAPSIYGLSVVIFGVSGLPFGAHFI